MKNITSEVSYEFLIARTQDEIIRFLKEGGRDSGLWLLFKHLREGGYSYPIESLRRLRENGKVERRESPLDGSIYYELVK